MNSGHSEKGREFCIRTETCLIDRDCSILTVPSPHPQSGLPLVKSSLVHQVGGVVGAGEGVVDGLVLHNHCAVVRHNVAVEVVDGGLVLEEGRRQKGLRILGKVVDEEKWKRKDRWEREEEKGKERGKKGEKRGKRERRNEREGEERKGEGRN